MTKRRWSPVRLDAEQQLPDAVLHGPDPGPHRHGRDADYRLGPGGQSDPVVGVRLGRRLRRGDLEEEGQPLVHPTERCPSRWTEVLGRQIITYVDDNTCTLQSVNRTVDGELLPNVEEVTITKQ
jgi:hypothetical protein